MFRNTKDPKNLPSLLREMEGKSSDKFIRILKDVEKPNVTYKCKIYIDLK